MPFTPKCRQHCSATELAVGRIAYKIYWEAWEAGQNEAAKRYKVEINSLKSDVALLRRSVAIGTEIFWNLHEMAG